MVDGAGVKFLGSGPGVQTQDGCSVDLYMHLPYLGELDFLPKFLPENATVLELGCGVGRQTKPMLAIGLHVTAVDNSAEMLANMPDAAEKILCDIQALHLNRHFDAVVMASNLINLPDAHLRSEILSVCRAHLSESGQMFFERHDPRWLYTIKVGPAGKVGDVQMHIDAFEKCGSELFTKLAYHRAESVWTQEFSTHILDDDEVLALVNAHGFSAPEWLSDSRRWGRCKLI